MYYYSMRTYRRIFETNLNGYNIKEKKNSYNNFISCFPLMYLEHIVAEYVEVLCPIGGFRSFSHW